MGREKQPKFGALQSEMPLADLDLSEGAPVKKLTLVGGKTYAGNAANQFQPAQPFEFLPASEK